MIRKCELKDIEQMVELAYLMNNNPLHESGFCPLKREAIHMEFLDGIHHPNYKMVGKFNGDELMGFMCFYLEPSSKNADCVGIFIKENHLETAIGLFEKIKTTLDKGVKVTFFVNKENKSAIAFFKGIKALNKGNELIMRLEKTAFKMMTGETRIMPARKSDYEKVVALHDEIFPDVYLPGHKMIESIGKNRSVFVLAEEEVILGYGVLKLDADATVACAEIIAVEKTARKKGFGRLILNHLAKEAFSIPQVTSMFLVVENINRDAIGLYQSIGFDVTKENCHYEFIA